MPLSALALTAPLLPNRMAMHHALAAILLRITADSNHSYEVGVRRLMEDLGELSTAGRLDEDSYTLILSTAVEVLFYFNYDLDALLSEANLWYRASLIHQMGHGMLQTIEKIRPDLCGRAFFVEAMQALALGESIPALRCRHWAADA